MAVRAHSQQHEVEADLVVGRGRHVISARLGRWVIPNERDANPAGVVFTYRVGTADFRMPGVDPLGVDGQG